MNLKKKVLLGVGAGVVSLVALTGAAFAQSGGSDTDPQSTFLDRLAQKLGIERSVLDNAVQSAREEIAGERLDALLADAVAAGRITQAEANEIKAWYNSRPDSADKVAGLGYGFAHFAKPFSFGGHHGFRGHGRGHGYKFGRFGHLPSAEGLSAWLDALVTAGTLTQAEADEIEAWVNARPDTLDELRDCPRSGESDEDDEDEQEQSSGTSSATALEAFFGIRA
jgi:hypothetical protein